MPDVSRLRPCTSGRIASRLYAPTGTRRQPSQTGLYEGNPPVAGVWAVPAGMRLSQAQSQPDTYLLARLDGLLKEVPPHRWHSRFHLDVSPDYPGGWLLAVDLSGTGGVDVRTHGEAAGHRALPFAPLTRDSGLLISARPAFGVGAGLVGRTDMRLSYEIAPAPQVPGLDDEAGASLTLAQGLIARFYDVAPGPNSQIPDLDQLVPEIERVDAVVNYPSTNAPWPGLPPTMADHFAARHQGYLYVAEAGEYTLDINSDDGSRLFLNGQPAIDNDGRHGMRRRSLTTHLEVGLHPIHLDYFENTGGAGLILSWIPPGSGQREVVPPGHLFHRPADFPDRAPTLADLPPGPVLPLDSGDLEPGLALSVYAMGSSMSRVPELEALTADLNWIDSTVHYPSTSAAWAGFPPDLRDYFATRHRGYLKVEEAGTYVIEVESDDGSLLHLGYLSGPALIDNDGRHAMRRRSAGVDLQPGFHPINLDFFENTGGAGLILRWQPPGADAFSVIPASHLYHGEPTPAAPVGTALLDRRPLIIDLPTEVRSSPQLIAGRAWSADHPVTAHASTLPGGSQSLARLGARDVFIDLPLDPEADTLVTVAQDGQPLPTTIDAQIRWLPISMYHNESITIRVGSSIKLLASDGYPDGDIHIDANGDGSADYIGPAYEAYVHRYEQAGVFTAIATNAAGEEIGRSVITVGNLRLPSRIAAQVGYRRPVDVHTGAFPVADLAFTAADPATMQVELVESDGPHARLSVRPLERGDHTLLIHHIPTGALLHSQEIHEFTLSVPSAGNMIINADDAAGILEVIMTPYIPDVTINFDMFAAKGSFVNGEKSFSMLTNSQDPVGSQQPGRVMNHGNEDIWLLELEVVLVGAEYCFSVWPTELDEEVSPSSASNAAIGAASTAETSRQQAAGNTRVSETEVKIGDTARVNGSACAVTRFWSLLFTRANDSAEDERGTLNQEWWFGRLYGIVAKSQCISEDDEDDSEGEKTDCDIKYQVTVSAGQQSVLPKQVPIRDPRSPIFSPPPRTVSQTQDCEHECKLIDQILTSNTPGKYHTSVRKAGDIGNGKRAGGHYLSMLDASGPEPVTNDQFPRYAEALPRLPGTLYQPVIVITKGGESGALYGVGTKTSTRIDAEDNIWSHQASRSCGTPTNVWEFSIRAVDPKTKVNIPAGYEVRWRQSRLRDFHLPSNVPMETEPLAWNEWEEGGQQGKSMESVRVAYGPGRHFPRAEIWRTHRWIHDAASGQAVFEPLETPELISYAEIHALMVEIEYDSNLPSLRTALELPPEIRSGSPFGLMNHAAGLGVDTRMSVQGTGEVRGRVSFNGYPQNQYWGGQNDDQDLAQVGHVFDSENLKLYIQGYHRWSPQDEFDLKLKIEGQAFIEDPNCKECWWFDGKNYSPDQRPTDGTRVTPQWMATDAEEFNSTGLRIVPDFNRDRQIDDDDIKDLESGRVWRLWINDDGDFGKDGLQGGSDIPRQASPDWRFTDVRGPNDLLDFFPLWIDASEIQRRLPPEEGYEYRISDRSLSEMAPIGRTYTSLKRHEAGNFHIQPYTQGFGPSLSEPSDSGRIVGRSLAGGFPPEFVPGVGWQRPYVLSPLFLGQSGNDGGVLMVRGEGDMSYFGPMVVEVWKDDVRYGRGQVMASIATVEEMYRWVNLRHVGGGAENRATDLSEPAYYPDSETNDKHFVFLHGYNVTENESRAWGAEMFKRLYQSGSQAKFTFVTWRGDQTRLLPPPGVTPNYGINVVNAFATAQSLAEHVNNRLPESTEVTIGAHSLGNLVTSSAVVDHEMKVKNLLMFNSAVPMEAYQVNVIETGEAGKRPIDRMTHPEWRAASAPSGVMASYWHRIFSDHNDARANLTWMGLFAGITTKTNVVNYYSSTEEVLDVSDGTIALIPEARKSWANQEMHKGNPVLIYGAMDPSQAGWSWRTRAVYAPHTGPILVNIVPDFDDGHQHRRRVELIADPYFDFFKNSDLHNAQLGPGSPGDIVAKDNLQRWRILAGGIPALSDATGGPGGGGFSVGPGQLTPRDFMGRIQEPWPLKRNQINQWHHGFMREVSYRNTYKLYDELAPR